ncbi:hypothetical protein HYH02_011113 [Chlamydomonas schloesseri]|uniref:Uncharacterized protein n=1 Tax=Chlamydomonas schloesseri TaxID=2026947 RepID=A0A835TGA4_9CHLO|nr:hypothetical protein HYH02_011113 [Chlamydomonas schloesseri]|eukprot:KAG2437736.1 hypothetical protein HYH02_011113 [Chlamydomonas schloesseri]
MRLATGAFIASLLAFAVWEVVGSTSTTNGAAVASVKYAPRKNSLAAGGETAASELSKSMDLLAKGKYESIKGTEVVWQLPAEGAKAAKGVVFMAHGCSHGAIDFWPKSDGCPQCTGLPEEMNITLHVLKRGYAAVAISSYDRQMSRCWQNMWGSRDEILNTASDFADFTRVENALKTLLAREGLEAAPLFAFGASSGGGFVLGLPPVMPGVFSGVAAQIMGGAPKHFAAYERARETDSVSSHWPPTALVHMPRDSHIAQLVDINMKELKALNIPYLEIQIPPQPLTPLYMAQRCAPEVDEATSKALYEALKAADYLDADGFLRHNPRLAPDWRMILQRANVPGVTSGKLRLEPDLSPIAEELNHLYGAHEISSESTTDLLDWWEKSLAAIPADLRAVGIKGEEVETVRR